MQNGKWKVSVVKCNVDFLGTKHKQSCVVDNISKTQSPFNQDVKTPILLFYNYIYVVSFMTGYFMLSGIFIKNTNSWGLEEGRHKGQRDT